MELLPARKNVFKPGVWHNLVVIDYSGSVMFESLETELFFHLRVRLIPWKGSTDKIFQALTLWPQICHASSVSYFLTVKNTRVWKYQIARTRRKDALYVNIKNPSFFFEAHLRIMNRWMSWSEIHSWPWVLPSWVWAGLHGSKSACNSDRFIYMVP